MFNKHYMRSVGSFDSHSRIPIGALLCALDTRVLQCGWSHSAQDYDSLVRQAPSSRYEYATESFVDSVIRAKVVSLNIDWLKTVWFGSITFAALVFFLLIMEKGIPPRKELNTELGMEEKANSTKTDQC